MLNWHASASGIEVQGNTINKDETACKTVLVCHAAQAHHDNVEGLFTHDVHVNLAAFAVMSAVNDSPKIYLSITDYRSVTLLQGYTK